MLIALDYDGTYTEDPELFDAFIALAQRRGHRVLCVSMRGPSAMINLPLEIIYTRGAAKDAYCHAQGIEIDVWIDDQPYKIVHSAGAL